MCRGAGDDFQCAGVLKCGEGGDEIFLAGEPGFANLREAMVVEVREFVQGFVPVRAMRFFFGEVDEFLEVARVTILQERIEEHGAERGREREREAGIHAIALPALQDLQEGDVGLGDGFKEPVFLQEFFVFRMADEGKVGVEDEREVGLHAGF